MATATASVQLRIGDAIEIEAGDVSFLVKLANDQDGLVHLQITETQREHSFIRRIYSRFIVRE